MKNLIEFIKAQDVFEAKLNYTPIDMTLDEYCSNVENLTKIGDNKIITEIHGWSSKYSDDIPCCVTHSFKAGFEWALNNKNFWERYFVIPFGNLNVVFRLACASSGELKGMGVYIVGPKDINIKSAVIGARSSYKYYERIFVDFKTPEKEIYQKCLDGLLKIKDNAQAEFAAAPTPAVPALVPDKSPYRLSKSTIYPNVQVATVKAEGKDFVYKYTQSNEAKIFVQTAEVNGQKYYKVTMGENPIYWDSSERFFSTYYLTSLGQLDKFLEFSLKPNRRRQRHELGEDGEIHIWSETVDKQLPAALKKSVVKDEEIIKKCKFPSINIYKLCRR